MRASSMHLAVLALPILAACQPAEPAATFPTTPPPPPPSEARASKPAPRRSLPLPSGVASGEVTSSSAIVWSRSDRDARMHVAVETAEQTLHATVLVGAERDFTGKVTVSGLSAGTRHRYTVWFTEPGDRSELPAEGALEGTFLTAPAASDARAVRFAWGGDLGGQNVCRDAREGYPIFSPLKAGSYDFFVALGDMIYSDDPCEAVGKFGNAQVPLATRQSATLGDYHAHWRYNRDDATYRAFLASTSYFSLWDDHEIVNDWGPKTDLRDQPPYASGVHLMPIGERALLDYNPIADGEKLERPRRWGKHVELFFIDNRRYRDDNRAEDSAKAPKQMLGEAQIRWLLAGLESSDATWKFVVSSVPLSSPTGQGPDARDGFASEGGKTGFERELASLFKRMRERDLSRTIWITTDVHFAAEFTYVPFKDAPGFVVHEFISGPLNAGMFPVDVYDKTFNPKRGFTWAIENAKNITSYEQVRALFNYGDVSVSAAGDLTIGWTNAEGRRLHEVAVKR